MTASARVLCGPGPGRPYLADAEERCDARDPTTGGVCPIRAGCARYLQTLVDDDLIAAGGGDYAYRAMYAPEDVAGCRHLVVVEVTT